MSDFLGPDDSVVPTGEEGLSLPGQPSAIGVPLFYWEFDQPERDRLRAKALVDEGYLAARLNQGIRMLADRLSDEECPDLDRLPAVDVSGESYSLAIASILQVAAWQGVDLEWVIEEAISATASAFNYSAGAANARDSYVSEDESE